MSWSCAIAEKSDVNEDADSDEPLAAVLVDDGTLVLDEEFDVALDDEPQAARAAAVIATSETAPARLIVDFRSDRRQKVIPVNVRSRRSGTSRDRTNCSPDGDASQSPAACVPV